MDKNTENAANSAAYALEMFASTIHEQFRESFFHPCNRDEWVPRFCEWFAAKQKESAQVRASND